MGLFTKKPKPKDDDTIIPPPEVVEEPQFQQLPPLQPLQPQQPPPAPQPEAPQRAQKPHKAKSGRKFSVDPTDFLALRSEVIDLRARLEASEQAKAIVETRLAALDATTTTLANERPGGGDLHTRLSELEEQLGTVAEAAAAAAANAESASAKAAAAATVASNASGASETESETNPALLARLDELTAQVQTAGAPDPMLMARIEAINAKIDAVAAPTASLSTRLDELTARVENTPLPAPVAVHDHARLEAIESRLGELAAQTEDPAHAAAHTGPDHETLARIDELAERVTAIDSFASQLSQLNARVTAQAEFGAQLSSLRDRISELTSHNNDVDERRTAMLAATGDADLRDRINALSDRMALNDGLADQIAHLAERVASNDTTTRQATEQVAAIEQRLSAVSTELANQVSELGRDIDGLAEHSNEVAHGAVSDEVIDALKNAQVKLAAEQARYEIAFRQDLAALAEQVRRGPTS